MNLPCTLVMLFSCFSFPESPDRITLKGVRNADTPGASALFAALPQGMDVVPREKIFLDWFSAGYIPERYSRFKAIHVNARGHQLVYWVGADYLALGNDNDFVLTPLSWTTVKILAARWRMLIPTQKMVDQIYQQADRIHWPHAYPPSDEMRSTAYLLNHNQWIQERSAIEWKYHPLIAGHKKDLVVTPRLFEKPQKLAIYGWQNLGNGAAIQPVSLWHGKFYVDYSHGIRFVTPEVELDGKPTTVQAILKDPELAPLLSFEGAFDICAVLDYSCD
ncbi:MAG: hypothetical protein H7249_06820 [Chitinophagaceae bacterium]|nr:hypothetical protein [Oligoflexus sp.]